MELEQAGIVGLGEAVPIYYLGETVESAEEFVLEEAPALVGDDPFALEEIGRRVEDVEGQAGGKAALDAALHDWIGKRLGLPVWRLLGLARAAPPLPRVLLRPRLLATAAIVLAPLVIVGAVTVIQWLGG